MQSVYATSYMYYGCESIEASLYDLGLKPNWHMYRVQYIDNI